MSQDGQLRKSHKMDFSNQTPMVSRERSFVRPNKEALKRRSQTMMAVRGKPSLEIYRPPNVRTDLNVHAKEFTMKYEQLPLQHSRSGFIPLVRLPLLYHPLAPHPVFTGVNQHAAWGSLKRSKSLGAAESRHLLAKEEVELGMFEPQRRAELRLAAEDPNQMPSRVLMDLSRTVLEKAVEGVRYSEPIAKLCVAIIGAERNHTFLESLLNTCQQWYRERDHLLRGVRAGDGTRFTAFMWFLAEMCGQLKRHQLREQFAALQPELTLLSVLGECCRACVSVPIECLAETECLFFVLTSIGRDLEAQLPQQLEQLLASVRDGVLASAGSPAVRRTLLQLIELHASNWQLPGSSVLYYYPRMK